MKFTSAAPAGEGPPRLEMGHQAASNLSRVGHVGEHRRSARARLSWRPHRVLAIRAAASRAAVGALSGVVMALLGLTVGAVRALGALITGTSIEMDGFVPGVLLYGAGFAAAGSIDGAMWPLRRSLLGRYLIGILGAIIVFVFIARAADGPFERWDRSSVIGIGVLGIIFGVVAGYQFGKSE